VNEVPADPASALCLSCGLCCDGGLFNWVALTSDDRTRLQANGLDGPEQLIHPCPHYSTPACTIYAVRPTQCSKYRCEVLKAFEAGEIDEGTAHGLVDEAVSMRVGVNELLPRGKTFARFAEDLKTGTSEGRSPNQFPALARFVAYRLYVERHFLSPDSHWLSREKA
jgi:Fe-S-cluster containining protein